MELTWKKMKRGGFLRCSVVLVCFLVSLLSLLLLLYPGLPEVSLDSSRKVLHRASMPGKRLEDVGLGKLGGMMVAMLPDDLAFTIFIPSSEAFERILKLRADESLVEQKMNNTYAILSRVMGFSAVPRQLPSGAFPLGKEISFDSISGLKLYIWRAFNGTLVVNNVRSEHVDIRNAETIVHIMRGVIMDADFEQSFSPDY